MLTRIKRLPNGRARATIGSRFAEGTADEIRDLADMVALVPAAAMAAGPKAAAEALLAGLRGDRARLASPFELPIVLDQGLEPELPARVARHAVKCRERADGFGRKLRKMGERENLRSTLIPVLTGNLKT